MLRMLIVALAALAWAAPAAAETVQLRLRGGFQTWRGSQPDLKELDSGHLSFGTWWRLNPDIHFGLEFDRFQRERFIAPDELVNLDSIPVTFLIAATFGPESWPVRPYAALGGGAALVKAKIQGEFEEDLFYYDEWTPFAMIRGGASVAPNERYQVFLDVEWQSGLKLDWDQFGRPRYDVLQVSAGVALLL